MTPSRGSSRALAPLLAGFVLACSAVSTSAASLAVRRIDTPSVSPTSDLSSGGGLSVTPNGSVVRLLVYPSGIERIDMGGHATAAAIPGVGATSYGPLDGTLTVLADGSTAFLAEMFHGIDDPRKALGTLARGSLRPHFVPLPASGPYTDWDASAIAPDGTVWRALACRGTISHTSRHGRETRIHLGQLGCDGDFRERYGAAFVFGRDGSAWFASLCQARIVHFPRHGARREWRLHRRPHCMRSTDGLRQPHPAILPTADGLRFAGGRIDGHGRLVDDSRPVPDAIAPDGAEWRLTPQAIERRAPNGHVTRFNAPVGGPRHFVAGTIGNGDRFWYLTAVKANGESLGYSNVQMRVGVLDSSGAGVETALPRSDFGGSNVAPLIAVGAGDGVWLDSQRYVLRVDLVRP